MDKAKFWRLIEASKNKRGDCAKQAAKLEKLLVGLDANEIVEFDRIFASLLNESYRWDLWAVAYIVNGGCSDDGFEYFRRWLIGRGQAHFEAALQDAERAADGLEGDCFCECEELGYASDQAYERKTGIPIYEASKVSQSLESPKEPSGTPWKEEELEALFPRLWKKFE